MGAIISASPSRRNVIFSAAINRERERERVESLWILVSSCGLYRFVSPSLLIAGRDESGHVQLYRTRRGYYSFGSPIRIAYGAQNRLKTARHSAAQL